MKIQALCSLLALALPSTTTPRIHDESRVLTVTTYNVHGIWVPPPFRPRRQRFPEIARSLERYDVAFLSELFTSKVKRDRFRQYLLESASQPTRFLPESDQGRIYSSGLAILSRLPPSGSSPGSAFIPYSECRGWGPFHGSDCEARKGILFGAVDLDGEALHLYATHLDAGSSAGDRGVRARQIAELQRVILEHSSGAPLILAGDFNTVLEGDEPDVLALRALRDALGLQSLCSVTPCERTACKTWSLCGEGAIDYIFFRSSEGLHLEALSAGWTENRRKDGTGSRLSDHPLLWGELKVRHGGGGSRSAVWEAIN